MALSAEARARLQEIVDHGFLPVLSVGVSDHQPEAGTAVTAFWDFRDLGAAGGLLRVGDRTQAIGPVGQHAIEVADFDFAIMLIADGQVATAMIRPRVIVPVISALGAHGPRVAASPVRISWLTQFALTAELSVRLEGGEELLHENVEAEGERVVTPLCPGRMRVRLVARSRHAHLSERATQIHEIAVPIAAPPVHIEISPAAITGALGQEARFSWRVDGARKIHLLAPMRDRSFSLEPAGRVEVTVGLLEETLILRAEGLDGRMVTKTFRVTPQAPDLSLPVDLMNHLDRPWTERPL